MSMNEYAIGDTVQVTSGDRWHLGEFGKVIDMRKGKILVSLPGPHPRTKDYEWLRPENLVIVKRVGELE